MDVSTKHCVSRAAVGPNYLRFRVSGKPSKVVRVSGAFAKLRKATVNVFTPALRPFLCPHGATLVILDGFHFPSPPPENLPVCEVMWRNVIEPDRPQMTTPQKEYDLH